jgi:hypothetical protein
MLMVDQSCSTHVCSDTFLLVSCSSCSAAVIKTLTKWAACFTPAYFMRTKQFLELLAAPDTPTSTHALLYHVRLVELLAKCATFSNNVEDKGEESQIVTVLKSLVPIEHITAVLEAPGQSAIFCDIIMIFAGIPFLYHGSFFSFLIHVYHVTDQVCISHHSPRRPKN